jgi:hypothetical protein
MADYSPLGKATANATEVENIDEAAIVAELEHAFGEDPSTSDGGKCHASLGTVDTLNEGVLDYVNSKIYYYRSSTITVAKIKEMEEKSYFLEDEAHALGTETVQSRGVRGLFCRWLVHVTASCPS